MAKRLLPRRWRQAVRTILWTVHDVRYTLKTGHRGFPPAVLRVRVHGSLDVPSFFAVGEQCAQGLIAALNSVGGDAGEFSSVLDFGCGSGRTLTALRPSLPRAELQGTDQDAAAIRWCCRHLTGATFHINAPVPPLDFPSGQFDLVFAISVFTHLDEDLQFLWLKELCRVTTDDALFVFTIHGPAAAAAELSPPQQEELAQRGFLFVRSEAWADFFPDFYHTTYHTRDYIDQTWARWFEVLDYTEQAMNGYQDMVTLRKKSGNQGPCADPAGLEGK